MKEQLEALTGTVHQALLEEGAENMSFAEVRAELSDHLHAYLDFAR